MQSLRYKETVRERQKEGRNKQVRRCTKKYSYVGHRVSEFYFFYIKSKVARQDLLWRKNIGIWRCKACETRKTVREYQKEGRNNEARCCIGKCSYAGYGVSEFKFFYIKSKIIRQALLWKKNIGIRRCRAWDTRETVRERHKEGRNKQVRRCTEKYSYPGHQVSEF